MRDVEAGYVELLLYAAYLRAHVQAQLRVEVRERLVHEQDLRAHDEDARERDALLLAARELVRVTMLRALEADHLERLGDLARHGRAALRAHLQPVADVVAYRHVREERVVLEDEAYLALVDHDVRHVLTVDEDASRGRRLEARDHAQRRRLAAARGAEERYELAALYVELDALDGVEARAVLYEGFPYVVKMKFYSHYLLPPCPL